MFSLRKRNNAGKEEDKLGRALYRQQKYQEAEEVLRQALQARKQVLGKEHADTLNSKHWLGRALFWQRKYYEAEKAFRQAVQGQEKVLGKQHANTLNSKHWLGDTLYRQQKYYEAEKALREAVQGQEKVLGKEHEHTLNSKHWLGHALYGQQKYQEAEETLRQVLQGQEKVLGKEHADTLNNKFWLGHALYGQQKYYEAEKAFRQAVQEQEKVLGEEHALTIYSIYWLGLALYLQQKYYEAEKTFRQALQKQEKVLGKEHEKTVNCIYWLGDALYRQQKYYEAEKALREAVQGQEKVLSKDHEHTLRSKRVLQELLVALSPPIPLNKTTSALTDHLSNFFPAGSHSRGPYCDSDIFRISSLLKHLDPRWAKVPRIYIVLRTIDCLNHLDDCINLGLSDHFFPFTERSLPHTLRPRLRTAFVNTQDLVLTKSMDLERGEGGQHCSFQPKDHFPFETKGVLGSGGFGQVDKVLSLISFIEYARKRVSRKSVFGAQGTENEKNFVAEIEILKRLKHRHIVEFVGSYTDHKYMGLIMSPVAEMDLSTYLKRADRLKHQELRTFFGCLARALEFLHEQKVRHKDIKPGNILVKGGNVLFTDFGLSFDFTDANGSTTLSMVKGMTPRYCAPEVAMQERRNTSSDVWSLGVVFLEMIVVLKGKTMDYIDEFFEQHGSQRAYVSTNYDAFIELVTELKAVGSISDNRAVEWIRQMLLTEPKLRPTAASLILWASEGSAGFCGICCSSRDDEFSDTTDELRGWRLWSCYTRWVTLATYKTSLWSITAEQGLLTGAATDRSFMASNICIDHVVKYMHRLNDYSNTVLIHPRHWSSSWLWCVPLWPLALANPPLAQDSCTYDRVFLCSR